MHKVGTVHEFCMFSGTHGALSPKDTVDHCLVEWGYLLVGNTVSEGDKHI